MTMRMSKALNDTLSNDNGASVNKLNFLSSYLLRILDDKVLVFTCY